MKLIELFEEIDPFQEPSPLTDEEEKEMLTRSYRALEYAIARLHNKMQDVKRSNPSAFVRSWTKVPGHDYITLPLPTLRELNIRGGEVLIDKLFPKLISFYENIIAKFLNLKNQRNKIAGRIQRLNAKLLKQTGTQSKITKNYGAVIQSPTALFSPFVNPYFKYDDPKYRGSPENYNWPGKKGLLYEKISQKLKSYGLSFDIVYAGTIHPLAPGGKKITVFVAIGCDGNLIWKGKSSDDGYILIPGSFLYGNGFITSNRPFYPAFYEALQKLSDKYKK